MKPYHTGTARLRAIYQLPTPPGNAAVLELHLSDAGRVLDDQWPAESLVSCRLTPELARPWRASDLKNRRHDCEASYHESLPFAPGSFDVVLLHHTLDELASVFRQKRPRQVVDQWLRQVASILRPGGLVVGCGLNRTSPGSWLRRAGAGSTTAAAEVRALSVLSCETALLQAGFCNPEVFNLLPDSTTPRAIASVEAGASKRSFRHALDATRESLHLPGYLARKALVELSLNRFLEDTLFFWGYKPC
jgi:SAM-dependent methyltransferase